MRVASCLLVFVLVTFVALPADCGAPADSVPTAGRAEPITASFDKLILELMERYEIPGAALAVSRGGQLLLSRGYGYADTNRKRPVQPDSRFRIASVSKPVTSVACLRLFEEGKLRLDDRALDLLEMECGPDRRIHDVTVRQLLLHTAGWDRDASFDPMFHFGAATADRIVREMFDRPLDFSPGTRHAYSNFGYCLLGRIIAHVAHTSYEDFVRREVFKPIRIESMRIGSRGGDDEQEVHYYGEGAYNLLPDVMDAHGGWVATAPDLVRFADAVQGRGQFRVLKPETVAIMIARPGAPLWEGTRHWYGLGWMVVPSGSGVNIWHAGAMPGTTSLLVSTRHGFSWAALFNRMPPVRGPFMQELDRGLWDALRESGLQ